MRTRAVALLALMVAACASMPVEEPPSTTLIVVSTSTTELTTTTSTSTTTTTTTSTTTTSTTTTTTTTIPPATTTTAPPTTTVPPATTTTAPRPTTTRPAATTTTPPLRPVTPAPDGVKALITPTGVPVVVRGMDGAQWVVFTPCGREGVLTGGETLTGATVVLDPGHGGADPGAIGPNGLREKTVNLRIARATQTLLNNRGISTLLTVSGDYSSILSARARLADALGAKVLVSIHHNASTNAILSSSVPGNEAFIQTGSDASRRLGGLLYKYSVAGMSQFGVSWISRPGAGVMSVRNESGVDTYGILRLPITPAALIELGYISNAPEAALFATDEYVAVAAKSVADAVTAYLNTSEAGSGYKADRSMRARPSLSQSSCVDPPLG